MNPQNNSRQRHVLIVDDNIHDFRLMSVMIRSHSNEHYDFHWAKDSAEAREALGKYWIDLVAVDYNLGSERGDVVIEKLRDTYPNIAYVMITGVDDPKLYKKGLEAGASGFILKDPQDAMLFDRTAHFAIEQQRVRNKLRAANASKNRLMSLLAEDLGNPLDTLIDSLALIRTQAQDLTREEIMKAVDLSYRSAYELKHSAESIVEWGCGEQGAMRPKAEMVNVTKCISRVINFLGVEAQKKKAHLNFQGDCAFKAYADERMLVMVLRDLMSEAIRSSGPGGQIDVRTRVSRGKMRIEVLDHSRQIKPQTLSRLEGGAFGSITEPRRADDSLGENLRTCLHLLDLLGADLTIDSVIGVGTSFSFELPVSLPSSMSDRTRGDSPTGMRNEMSY